MIKQLQRRLLSVAAIRIDCAETFANLFCQVCLRHIPFYQNCFDSIQLHDYLFECLEYKGIKIPCNYSIFYDNYRIYSAKMFFLCL